ncbi:MAG: ABC transporter permease [Phycisphaeraceae bacterium]|nr:MAG: ABC transporter permease [Phycisphaeraceae bacterium]
MIGLILRRLAQIPVVLLVIYTVTFALSWALPGSAVLNDEGRAPPAAVIDAIEKQYSLDDPVKCYTQYLVRVTGIHWLSNRISGPSTTPTDVREYIFDFGPSFRFEDWSVNEIIVSSLPVSVALGLSAIAIALGIGLSAGVIGAVRPNSWIDFATLAVALVGISLPSFVTGTLLLILGPVWAGVGTVGAWGTLGNMLLPAFTLSLPFAAYIARLTRMGMIEALSADYIRTARAKGVGPTTVVLKHALKNAFLPVLSYLGPAAAYAMTGSFVIETVFNIPGIGQHFVDAVRSKDLFLIMGVTLVFASILVFFNLAVDLLYRFVDPRIEQ